MIIIMNNKEDLLVKLLGVYSRNFGKNLNINKFNDLLSTFGVNYVVDITTINDLLNYINTNSKYEDMYNDYSFSRDVNYVDLICEILDIDYSKYDIDSETFNAIVNYVTTFQELRNGNLYANKLSKRFEGISFTDDLINDILSVVNIYTNVLPYLDNQEDVISHGDVSDVVTKLNMKQRELQNLSRKYNKLKRDVFDSTLFKNKALEELKNIHIDKPNKIEYKKCLNPNTITLVVSLSDVHVGLKTKDFDKDILKKRLHDYIVSIAEYTYSHDIDNIYIVNLGDTIENIYMHLNQMASVEMDLSHQVAMAVKYVVEFVQDVRNLGYPTYYIGIMGNHDRLNPNVKQNIVGDGVNTIVNAYIEANQDILDVNYIEPYSNIRHLLNVHGKDIALVHGDYDKVNKPDVISKLSNYFDNKVDIVLSGHYHNLFIKTLGRGQYILQNGAFFTGNPYSESLGVSASASQILLGIDTHGNIDVRPIIFK